MINVYGTIKSINISLFLIIIQLNLYDLTEKYNNKKMISKKDNCSIAIFLLEENNFFIFNFFKIVNKLPRNKRQNSIKNLQFISLLKKKRRGVSAGEIVRLIFFLLVLSWLRFIFSITLSLNPTWSTFNHHERSKSDSLHSTFFKNCLLLIKDNFTE